MQTGVGRRKIILIMFGVFLTILLVFGIYLFIFRSPNVLIVKNSETKIDLVGLEGFYRRSCDTNSVYQ